MCWKAVVGSKLRSLLLAITKITSVVILHFAIGVEMNVLVSFIVWDKACFIQSVGKK